jgi:hypothetical protein
MCHTITGHRWKWHIAIARNGLFLELISTPLHLTKLRCTQHNIAVYMHTQNTEDVLLPTVNIANYSLPFTLHWCAMDINNKLHIHPRSKYNTITQSNKMKVYCFDIKTGINETKQQSTRLEKNNNIHHQSCKSTNSAFIVPDTCAATNVCIWTEWTAADTMLQLVIDKYCTWITCNTMEFWNAVQHSIRCCFVQICKWYVYMNYVAYSATLL